ncbi:hypothetical protein [Paenibacillus soyae]|uniref:Uncharacterized protein n=1 Tax=Paenibacillus soyae TaxID=2969249 RepID=A0A9X2MPI8_9BACL|nr:hypothetical protein [Paenibacillus soyae]MCR2803478.1 hypothetical protein [Paenibacillus soyae]
MNTPNKHSALKVAGSLWSSYRMTLIWFWAIFVVVFLGINFLLLHLGEVDSDMWSEGIWAGSVYSPKIFLFVIGILVTPISLASYVSFGITRKHFVWGSTLMLAGLSLVCAILTAAGFPIERLIYDMTGGSGSLNQPPLLESSLEFFVLCFGYCLAGCMIGNGFYRHDWRIGTIICLLALLPIILMEAIVESGSLIRFMSYSFHSPSLAPWLELILTLAIAAMMLALNFSMLRKVTIRRKLV